MKKVADWSYRRGGEESDSSVSDFVLESESERSDSQSVVDKEAYRFT